MYNDPNNLGAPAATPQPAPAPTPGTVPVAPVAQAAAPVGAAPAVAPVAPVAQVPIDQSQIAMAQPAAPAPAPMAPPVDPFAPATDPNVAQTPEASTIALAPEAQPVMDPAQGTPAQGTPEPRKSNKLLLIIAGVAVVVAIVVLVFMNMGSDSSTPPANTTTPGNTVGNTTGNVTPGGDVNNNTTPTPTGSTYTLKSSGFTFEIPSDLIVETNGGDIYIAPADEAWFARVAVLSGNYDDLADGLTEIINEFISEGYDADNEDESSYGDATYVTLEVTEFGTNVLVAYTGATTSYVYGIEVYSDDNAFNYDALEVLSQIFVTAEYATGSGYSNSTEDIDLDIGPSAVEF